jgi:arginyl-tRNA synthetase
MSKRRGEIVTMSDLIDQVGVDAARYFFLMRRLSSHFDFDMDLAVRRSEDNPVYYVQYAHARTCNVLLHAAARGYSPEAIAGAQPDALDQPEELEILKIAAEFPHVVRLAAETVEPRKLTSYAETVAAAFHQFYQKHRIVADDSPRTKARLLLTTGVKNLLRMTLGLLGVTAPERM